jgi:hypothetical protein
VNSSLGNIICGLLLADGNVQAAILRTKLASESNRLDTVDVSQEYMEFGRVLSSQANSAQPHFDSQNAA